MDSVLGSVLESIFSVNLAAYRRAGWEYGIEWVWSVFESIHRCVLESIFGAYMEVYSQVG